MSKKGISQLLAGFLFLALIGSTTPAASQDGSTMDDLEPQGGGASPKLWVTPLILDFGPQGVGTTSAQQIVTITNLGTATLTNFAGGGVNPPFSASQNCAGGVPAGGSCQYFFTFTPTAAGVFTANSNSSTNAGSFRIEVRGKGVGAGLWVTPLSLDFGSITQGYEGYTQKVTIHNTGLSTLASFAGGGVYAPFHASQNCAGGVPPGGSCQYFYDFAPSASGTFTTTSNSSTNAGSFSIALKGKGRTSVLLGTGQRVTPLSLDFGPVGLGLTSATQVVTITNQSWLNELGGFSGGGVSAPFYATQNCAGGVPVGGNCQYYFYFKPVTAGTFTASSNSSDNVGSFSIALRGTGVGASLTASPLLLDFGPVPVGNTSATQIVVIKNTGPITLSSWSGGGVYAPFSATQNCAGGVPPGGSCQYNFKFSPTQEGWYTATSSSSTNGGSFSIQLQGGAKSYVFLPLVRR
jgi:hypothetical protein